MGSAPTHNLVVLASTTGSEVVIFAIIYVRFFVGLIYSMLVFPKLKVSFFAQVTQT